MKLMLSEDDSVGVLFSPQPDDVRDAPAFFHLRGERQAVDPPLLHVHFGGRLHAAEPTPGTAAGPEGSKDEDTIVSKIHTLVEELGNRDDKCLSRLEAAHVTVSETGGWWIFKTIPQVLRCFFFFDKYHFFFFLCVCLDLADA